MFARGISNSNDSSNLGFPSARLCVVPALRSLIAAPHVSGSDHLRHAPSRGTVGPVPRSSGGVFRVVPTLSSYTVAGISCTWSADGTFRNLEFEIRAVCTRYLGCVSEAGRPGEDFARLNVSTSEPPRAVIFRHFDNICGSADGCKSWPLSSIGCAPYKQSRTNDEKFPASQVSVNRPRPLGAAIPSMFLIPSIPSWPFKFAEGEVDSRE